MMTATASNVSGIRSTKMRIARLRICLVVIDEVSECHEDTYDHRVNAAKPNIQRDEDLATTDLVRH
jgi:hypothetical protein